MLAIFTSITNWIVDSFRFAAAVYQDARAARGDAEDKYGCLGF